MKSLNLNKYFFLFICYMLFFSTVNSEDSIDIWKKGNLGEKPTNKINTLEEKQKKINISNQDSISEELIQSINLDEPKENLYGIFDPDKNNYSLDMWSRSDGDKIKNAFSRINKIKLSQSAEDIFINTILTYSYLPKNMTDDEFLDLKVNWLIKNKKDSLLEEFLNKNKNFKNKNKIIQYLVDKNIAKANLNEGCRKSEFISKEIKDSYLEKFKIYCLIFNNKKNEAQLLFDILKEQNMSDKYFDDKANFLLGVTNKTNKKVRDDNLLNFYLSSVTIPNFTYEPNEKTNTFIWEYLNSANLVKFDDVEDKEKLKNLEFAANKNAFDKEKIFEIYKKFSFDLNSLINAEQIYRSLDDVSARAIIYQKYLLSDNVENKIKLLLLMEELFKKEKLSNVFAEFMSNKLKELDEGKIPEDYKEIVEKNIISEVEYKLGKIKYDDKILHRSRVLRYYTEPDTPVQKTQKDFNSVYKKIKRNKKYFFSAKDLALIESLKLDGFNIPKDINDKELAKNYSIPNSLLVLLKNREIGLLSLKFVEIIGEDEISSLDPETIYFITNILNQAKLIKIRNKTLISSLPLRS
tara:strand:+ start:13019 stop:14752 length:1734 start_codon:yes stop_codon:yes gene_type:complete